MTRASYAGRRVAAGAGELREILTPYEDAAGGHRCPLEDCRAAIRVVDGPPAQIVGCAHCGDLLRLAVDALAYRSTLPGAA